MSAESIETGRLALYTTVYPGVEPFLRDWFGSVESQTDQGFDLWIGADGLSPAAVATAIGAEPCANWIRASAGDTPGALRAAAMERMAAEYPAVVFVDSDDMLLPDRVGAARASLQAHDLAACALRIVNRAGKDLGSVLEPPPGVSATALLPRYNVFGLSNTAYRTELLRECLPVPPDCLLVDWLLAIRAWSLGASIDFDRQPGMLYRQYGTNVARVLPPFEPDYVLRSTLRVLHHYDLVLNHVPAVGPEVGREIEAARADVRAFYEAVAGSAPLLEQYTRELNRIPPQFVWWWCVAHPQLETLWRV